MRLGARLLLVSCFLAACGSESETDDDGGSTLPGEDAAQVQPDSASPTDAGTRDADAAPASPRDTGVYVPPARCGDNVHAESEECDDGDRDDGDGCDASCHKEAGFNCPAAAGACAAICGDRLLVLGELCDDGDSEAGDGCSETCSVEAGWSCLSSGMDCVAAACGDGIMVGAELCDDGDADPGDGCSTQCTVEDGWLCPVMDEPCSAARCGDGIRAGTEACDDGFAVSGDGCTISCDAVEPNYACPDLGGVCTRTSVCGNGLLTSDEVCDDRNTIDGDGCSANCKVLEVGWLCAGVGRPCTAAACGDGIIAGSEQCEDGDVDPAEGSDGCKNCQIETDGAGWACDWTNGKSVCRRPVCQDGKVEGNESCDQTNDIVGDGCGPTCVVEPLCAPGQPCESSCGDGIRLPSDTDEECDDGNRRNDDGCSDACKIEAGFRCQDVRSVLPDSFALTVVYRDFIALTTNGSTRHPDFEGFNGSALGLVGDTLVAGKPAYTGACEYRNPQTPPLAAGCSSASTSSEANFNEWYSNTDIPTKVKKYVDTMVMNKEPNNSYRNQTFGSQLFPNDARGWVTGTSPKERLSSGHNFGFTSEIHHWFEFNGGETLTFSGDDDVWVFIGGKLALDIGGVHGKTSRTIVLSNTGVASCYNGTAASGTACATATRSLGLTVGNVYEMALFHAERHTSESNFDITLTGFNAARSVCTSMCGDGVVTRGELCDDGSMCEGGLNAGASCDDVSDCTGGGTCKTRNDGSYGRCNSTCTDYGPHCGDGTVQAANGESCDKGFEMNMGGYKGCTQACKLGPDCGDGKVDGAYGERCDLGTANNVGGYDGCSATCQLAERCGDGAQQSSAGEVCDDGTNRSPYGGCGPGCVLAPRCGDAIVDRARGEQCDLGSAMNTGTYGGCTANCTKGSRCGDRVIDATNGELCDDGNLNDYDGCSADCRPDLLI